MINSHSPIVICCIKHIWEEVYEASQDTKDRKTGPFFHI